MGHGTQTGLAALARTTFVFQAGFPAIGYHGPPSLLSLSYEEEEEEERSKYLLG